jgi:hypothetical protein
MEDEEPKDEWYRPHCRSSTYDFLQWQEELERIVDTMYPEVVDKQKRFHMYCHMTHKLHGHLGKDNWKPLPPCFQQGLPEGFVPIRGVHGLQAEPF